MGDRTPEFRMLIRSQRFISPGVLDTYSELAPMVEETLTRLTEDLAQTLGDLDGGGWSIVSHSVTFHAGLMIVTFLVRRGRRPEG